MLFYSPPPSTFVVLSLTMHKAPAANVAAAASAPAPGPTAVAAAISLSISTRVWEAQEGTESDTHRLM